MESIALTVKLVVMYGPVVLVVAAVGATLIAALYQLTRDQVRGALAKTGKDRASVAFGKS
jgi:hypothetical protein